MASATRLSLLETALNRILASDPDTPARLARLRGRTVRIDSWLARDVRIYASFDDEGIHLAEQAGGEVDATIGGGPLGFARAAADPASRDVFSDGTLSVSGDALLVQSVVELFRRYRYDWQGRVEPVIGEAATWRIERWFQQLDDWLIDARGKLAADAGDYLREERRLLASRDSVADFADAVDALAADASRLEKRIRMLENRRR